MERRRLAVQRSLDSSGKVTLVKSRASHRTLDLADGSVATLSRRMAGSGPWIFPGKKPGRPYTYSGLVGAHDRVLERIGFGVDVYSFRHTFATDLYRHTKDLALVAKVLGHANLRTVQRYVHLSQEDVTTSLKSLTAADVANDLRVRISGLGWNQGLQYANAGEFSCLHRADR